MHANTKKVAKLVKYLGVASDFIMQIVQAATCEPKYLQFGEKM